MLYTNLIYLLLSLFLAYKLIKRQFNLFHVYIFLIPFHSWYYDVGLNLSISQIVNLLMVFYIPALLNHSNFRLNFGSKYIILFLIYAILSTIIISGFFIDDFLKLGGFFRSEGRFIGQLVLLLISFSIIPLGFFFIKDFLCLHKYIKVYLLGLLVLTVLGILQFITFFFTGVDVFPLNLDEFGDVRSGIYAYEQTSFFRMSSLGGEPKGFSMSLIIGFFIIQTFNRYGILFFKFDTLIKYLFLITGFATLSTSGIILFLILYPVYLFLPKKSLKQSNGVFKKINIIKIVFLAIVGSLIFKYTNILALVAEQRIIERNILREDYDAPIQIFLTKFPEYVFFGSGLGNIHNLAHPYIPADYLHYMKNTIFIAKSGYLKIISELGIIGFLLFSLIFVNVYKNLNKLKSKLNTLLNLRIEVMQNLLILFLFAFFARVYLQIELILFLSFCNVLVFSKRVNLVDEQDYSNLT